MYNRLKQAQSAASDAVVKTLENGFDLFKTAKDLHEKYNNKDCKEVNFSDKKNDK